MKFNSGMNKYNLRTESKKYINLICYISFINDDLIQEIKKKILSDYYSESEVVDTISKNILSMLHYVTV